MTTVSIDISDWVEEVQQAEVEFPNKEALLKAHIQQRWSPLKTGRLAIAARELGAASEDILPPNRLLLNSGAAVAVMHDFASQWRTTKINGKDQRVRAYVGEVGEDGVVSEESYVFSTTPEAAQRARAYLLTLVPGHVWSRLMILADQGEDVAEVAEALKEKIDELVERLTEREPVTEPA